MILAIIAIPLIFLFLIIINLSGSILAATIFEVLGHLLLRAYDKPDYNLRLLTSAKVGAVGGAIAAIPFNIFYSFLEGLVAPSVIVLSTEDGSQPLLRQQENDMSSMHRTSRMLNDRMRRTRRNPLSQNLYGNQQLRVESPSKAKVRAAILGDMLSGPILGALSGAVGSMVLGTTGHVVLGVSKGAAAGALGGFVLGPLSALFFTSIFVLGMALWLSLRSR